MDPTENVFALLGALGAFGVALQALLLVVARFVPQASPAARVLAVLTTDVEKVVAFVGRLASRAGKPHGYVHLRIVFGLALLVPIALVAPIAMHACTPAQRAALNVPAMSQIDAIGIAVSHAVGWCEAHGADATAVATAREALTKRDPGLAISVVRKMLQASAAAGEPVPPELIATIELAEGLLAAKAVQEGMQAITYLRTKDAGAHD